MGVCALVYSTNKKLCSDICLINLLFLKVIRYLSSGTCLKVKRKNHPSMAGGENRSLLFNGYREFVLQDKKSFVDRW